MSVATPIERLIETEQRLDLWNRRVFDYPVWPHFRLREYLRYQGTAERSRPANQTAYNRTRLMESLRDARRALSALALRGDRSSKDVWILSSTAYRRNTQGSSECMFTGPLVEQFGERVRFLEFNAEGRKSLQRPDVVFTDAARELSSMLTGALLEVPERVGALDRFQLGELPSRPVARTALLCRMLLELWRVFVRVARPQVAFVLCGYSPHIPAQIALREAGVPLIELQHGVIHESHPGYVWHPTASPLHRPDHLVVFGDHFGHLVERACPYWLGRWTTGGHPWLKRAQVAESPARENRVVCFSQNTAAVQRRLVEFLTGLRRALSQDVSIVLKPHPGELDAETVYAPLGALGVKIEDRTSDSYELLRGCRMALNVYSTLSIEALAFPCQSVVLRSEEWFEDIRALVRGGQLLAVDSPEEVRDLLQAPWSPQEQGQLAASFFGVGLPDIDYHALLARVRGGLSRP